MLARVSETVVRSKRRIWNLEHSEKLRRKNPMESRFWFFPLRSFKNALKYQKNATKLFKSFTWATDRLWLFITLVVCLICLSIIRTCPSFRIDLSSSVCKRYIHRPKKITVKGYSSYKPLKKHVTFFYME